MDKVFPPSSGEKEESKLDQKCYLWARPFSINTRILRKIFKVFLFARMPPLMRISAILNHIGRVRAQKGLF